MRYATAVRLRPERREEYLALHASVWPAVEAALRAGNIHNFSIFLHGDVLFGYYEYVGTDYAADMARLDADPETRRWLALTDPCQERLDGTPAGRQWLPLAEVWHMD